MGDGVPPQQMDLTVVKSNDDDRMAKIDAAIFAGIILIVQAIFFVYCAVAKMDYGHNDLVTASEPIEVQVGGTTVKVTGTSTQDALLYTMFIHVSIMIFFGFGFLMTFLRRYGYSSVGLCVITSCLVVQLSLVMSGVFKEWAFDWGGDLNLKTLLVGLFCAGAVMISMGAVLGKTSPAQLLLMAVIETVLFWVNMGIYFKELEAHDAAGGVVIHTFGAYFGLACAKVLTTPDSLEHKDNEAIYSSDMFSLAGTLFLWLLWPSFCGIEVGGPDKFLAVCNTYLCLVGSVLGFAFCSRLLHAGKLNIVEMQNATLAGGVAIGVCADYAMGPAGAMALGLSAGAISTVGYAKLDLGMIGLSDTCGVHNLHGMPGVLGAIVGLGCYKFGDQILGLLIALGIAILGGLATGAAIKFLPAAVSSNVDYFNDKTFWEVPEDYDLSKA